MQNGFDNNHCTIYNQTEIQSSQAHQIAAQNIHHNDGKEHRKRNNRCYQQRLLNYPRTTPAQNDYQSTFCQIGFNSPNGIVDHFGSV